MCSGLGSRRGFLGRSRVMGWPEPKERVGGLGCACRALDWACGSQVDWLFCFRVVADGLGCNWAYEFGLRRLGHGSRRVLG